ncbi:hypothetical protein L0657_22990 [Dyadobacter sp. CY345]|uniref:hypothetical protein n=1 Tax=Dyadobacter sp. CY345 TaxID=2909335 RepID=UPI001F267835|nr:hypothetical protein [Dyadobacter sp. CY345]MCF2446841.1 hypothetical protein [Dyadobacter sp. CY345]
MKISSPVAVLFAVLLTSFLAFSIMNPFLSFGNSENYGFDYFKAFLMDFHYFWTLGIFIIGVFSYVFYTISKSREVEENTHEVLIDMPIVTIDSISPNLFKVKNIGPAPAIDGGFSFLYKKTWSEIQTAGSMIQGEEFVFSGPDINGFTGFEYHDLSGNIYSSVICNLEPDSIYKKTYFFNCALQKISRRALFKRVNTDPFRTKSKTKLMRNAKKLISNRVKGFVPVK